MLNRLGYGLVTAGLLASAAIAVAQQLPTTQPVELTLKVTQAELDVISNGLQTQPFSQVASLINKLRAQIMEQQQAKASTAPLVPSPSDEAKPKE